MIETGGEFGRRRPDGYISPVTTNTGTLPVTNSEETPGPAAQAKALVGYHYQVDDYYEVGREKVREYARAVQDYHPLHWDETTAAEYGYDGLVAPLTFISLVGILAQRRLFESVVSGYDLSQIMQTDQVLEFHRPIVVGDQLTCDVYLDSFRQAFGGDIIVTKNVVTDQDNRLVMTTYTTLVGRSGVDIDPAMLESVGKLMMHGVTGTPEHRPRAGSLRQRAENPLPARSTPSRRALPFEQVSVGMELPPRTVRVTRGDLVNYAGVTGDANPIHWSDEVVRLVGLDDVVGHGMLSMGLGAGFLTSWLGDPGAVTGYNVRFTSPVYVSSHEPAEIEFTGKVKSVDPDNRRAVVAIVAKSGGRKIFGRATATVQLR